MSSTDHRRNSSVQAGTRTGPGGRRASQRGTRRLGLFRSRKAAAPAAAAPVSGDERRRPHPGQDNGRALHRRPDPPRLARTQPDAGPDAGQIRVRTQRLQYATPWFDYLTASPQEMAQLAQAGGWRLDRTIVDGPDYVGLLVKERARR